MPFWVRSIHLSSDSPTRGRVSVANEPALSDRPSIAVPKFSVPSCAEWNPADHSSPNFLSATPYGPSSASGTFLIGPMSASRVPATTSSAVATCCANSDSMNAVCCTATAVPCAIVTAAWATPPKNPTISVWFSLTHVVRPLSAPVRSVTPSLAGMKNGLRSASPSRPTAARAFSIEPSKLSPILRAAPPTVSCSAVRTALAATPDFSAIWMISPVVRLRFLARFW